MKCLMILTGGLGTGGLERISCFVANKFSEKGWKVVILTLLQGKEEKSSFQSLNQNVQVFHYPGKNDPIRHKYTSVLVWNKMIKDATRLYKPDSILAMTFKIASLVCIAAPKYASKITIREISDPKSKVRNPIINWLTEILCRNVKNVIFQTNWEKKCYRGRMQRKGVVIPNPISISLNKQGMFNQKKIFTLTRLLLNQKRQDILIKAFELVYDKHPDYYLEIYGRGEDKTKILDLIACSKARNNISIIEPKPNIHETVIDYRCFVLTSDYEGMSNALLECYSLGIPCISSDWPGVEDIISNEEDGLIYIRQDILGLANAMARIVESEELCYSLTNEAAQRAVRFNEYDIINKYCEVIEGE